MDSQVLPAQLSPPSLSADQGFHKVLEWGSQLMGVVCLFDVLTEALSGGTWHSYTDIYRGYQIILGGYAGTREWEKWTAPETDESRWGHWFVGAWVLTFVGLWALSVTNAWSPPPVWPAHLTETFGWVIAFFSGGKMSGHLRKSGWRPLGSSTGSVPRPRTPAGPIPDSAQRAYPSPAPRARSTTSPAVPGAYHRPAPPEGEDDSEGGGTHVNPDTLQAVEDAARKLGTFAIAQVSRETGISDSTVDRCVHELIQQGKVEKIVRGKYRWIGG